MSFSKDDLMETYRYLTPIQKAFRIYFVIDLAICIYAFIVDLDLGFFLSVSSVGLFFVVYNAFSILDDYYDSWCDIPYGENEVYADGGKSAIRVSVSRYVIGVMPFYIYVDGVCVARLFRGTSVEIPVNDSDIEMRFSREKGSSAMCEEPYVGRPADMKIVTVYDECTYSALRLVTEDTPDVSQEEYRHTLSTFRSHESEQLFFAVIVAIPLVWEGLSLLE